jgi:hypothetical protein
MLPVEQLAPLLLAYQERLLRLAEDTDASWLRRLEREEGLPPVPSAGTLARRSALLRVRLRMAPVAPDSFTPPAHRLAVLDKPALLRVLAARALFAHRAALGLCVDGTVLGQLRTLVGTAALSGLRGAGFGDQAGGLADEVAGAAPLPAHADLLAWAVEGYGHFERDAVWRESGLRRLIRLALPAAAAEAMEAAATAARAATPATPATRATDSDALLALLPTLFPELTWLFG